MLFSTVDGAEVRVCSLPTLMTLVGRQRACLRLFSDSFKLTNTLSVNINMQTGLRNAQYLCKDILHFVVINACTMFRKINSWTISRVCVCEADVNHVVSTLC